MKFPDPCLRIRQRPSIRLGLKAAKTVLYRIIQPYWDNLEFFNVLLSNVRSEVALVIQFLLATVVVILAEGQVALIR